MATKALREDLVKETLKFAIANAPWYRRTLSPSMSQYRSIADLVLFPATSKTIFAANADDFITDDHFPIQVGISSGTTFRWNQPILTRVYRSKAEAEAFRLVRSAARPDTADDLHRPLALQLVNVLHGDKFAPEEQGFIRLPLDVPFHYAHIRDVLLRNHRFENCSSRVQVLVGTVTSLQLLTALLIQRDPQLLPQLRIETIYAHSWLLTNRWRKLFNSIYGAEPINIYGISEIAGAGSSECAACGQYHMPPFIMPEVLALDDDAERIERGIGELTLTSLLPFAKTQPLIRFRTGDLVEVGSQCPVVPDLGFRFRGRRSTSVVDQSLGLLLGSATLLDVADGFTEVNIEPHPTAARFEISPGYGLPRLLAKIEHGRPKQVAIDVELAFEPEFNEAATNRFCDEFRAKLLSAAVELTAATSAGHVELCIRPIRPGLLGNAAVFRG